MVTLSPEVRDRLVRALRPAAEVEGLALGLALLSVFDALSSPDERIAALAFVLNNYPLIEFAGEKTPEGAYPATDRYAHGGADHDSVVRADRAFADTHFAALQTLDGARARTDPVDDVLAAQVWAYLERLPRAERAFVLFSILKYSLFMQLAPLPESQHGRGTIAEHEVGRFLIDRREQCSAANRCFLDPGITDDLTRSAALLDVIMSLDDARERAMLLTVVTRIFIRITTVKAGSDAIREYIAQTSDTAASRH